MAIPEFVSALREHIGHAPLWLSGTTAIVLDREQERILLVRRSDNGQWTPITGIIDPGEEPGQAAVREAREEADVDIRPVRLISVGAVGPVTHANGDVASYLDIAFECEHLSGDPHPADGENTETRWFSLDEMPPMNARFSGLVALALENRSEAVFR